MQSYCMTIHLSQQERVRELGYEYYLLKGYPFMVMISMLMLHLE